LPAIRRALLLLHLCCGLTVSVYAVLIGVTGSLLVFRAELTALEFPEFHSGELRLPAVGPDLALAKAREAFPGFRPLTVTWPHAGQPSWMVYVLKGREAREVFVDLQTGQIAGSRDPRSGWTGGLAQLHANLWAGRTGSLLNGYGACAVATLGLSGIWLWLTGAGKWRSRLQIDFYAGWRKLAWQLHHSTGIVSVAFVLLLSVTGTYFVWSSAYVRAVERAFGRSREPSVPRHPRPALLPIAALAERGARAIPGLPIHRVQVVESALQPVRVTLREGAPAEFHRVSTVFLDPVTGDVLGELRLAARPFGDSLLAWFSAAHFGIFGGLPVRILWAATGLAFPVMSVTGFLMWWRRVVEPRFRKEVETAQRAGLID
jgi:uncharacterized iron-regulated membrane protein